MSNKDKKYFIPVDGITIEVSIEVYRAYYQPIWLTSYHAQKNGECLFTKVQLWKCDGASQPQSNEQENCNSVIIETNSGLQSARYCLFRTMSMRNLHFQDKWRFIQCL